MTLRPGFERVRELVHKELIQVFRDPRLLRMVIVAPILQLLAFGYAVSTDVRETPTFVVDQDHTAASRDLTAGTGQVPAAGSSSGATNRKRRSSDHSTDRPGYSCPGCGL